MRQGKQCQNRIVGVLLALALVFGSLAGLVPGTQMTAKAAVDKKFNLGDRVKIGGVPGREWYVIKQDSTSVTLLPTKCFGNRRFGITSNYSSSYIKKDLEKLMSGELAEIKTALCEAPRLLTADEAEHIRIYRKNILKCAEGHYWWTQTASGAKNQYVRDILVRCVNGDFAWIQKVEDGKPTMSQWGMRPAIRLDLSKVEYDDESKEFYIIPDPPAPVEAPKAVIRTYPTPKDGLIENGELQELLEKGGEVENGTMVYTLTTDEPTQKELDALPFGAWYPDFPKGKDAKTYYVCFKARGDRGTSGYFEDSEADYIPVKIISRAEAKKASVAEWPEAKLDIIANGTDQDLLKSGGRAENGEMLYALGTDSENAPAVEEFSASIPKGTDAGIYYVWFKAQANTPGYEDSEPAFVIAEILKLEAVEKEKQAEVIEEPKPKSKVIPNGQPQELVTPGTGTQGVMVYALGNDAVTVPPAEAFSESIPKVTGPGTYYLWFRIKGDEGFVDTDPVCVVIVIRGSNVTEVIEEPKPNNKVIPNGQPQELVTPGTAAQGVLVYALGQDAVTVPPDEAFSESIPKATDPGTYYVWFRQKTDEGFANTDPVCVVVVIRGGAVTPTTVPDNTSAVETSYSSSNRSSGSFGSSDSSGGGKSSTVLIGGKKSSRGYYNKLSKNTVEYASPKLNKNAKTAVVPATIKVGKKTYKVTAISSHAFIDSSNLQSVIIGKNVKRISPYAFFGADKLKTVKLATKQLTAKKIKGCLKDSKVDKVIVLKKAKSQFGHYKKIFTKKITGAANKVSVKKQK